MSRVLLSCFMLLFALCGAANAQALASARQTFDLGVEAYRQGDFPRAKTLWLALLDQSDLGREVDRAALLSNLGNASARSGAMLEAAAWYTSALKLDPRRSDTWKNLEFARREAKLEPADKGDLGATLRRVFGALSTGEAAWLSIALSATFFAALLFEALRGGALARRLALLFGALAITSLVPWHLARERECPDTLFVLAQGGADLRSEPRNEATSLERLAAASEVQQLDSLPGWIKVSGTKTDSGWVREEQLFALHR